MNVPAELLSFRRMLACRADVTARQPSTCRSEKSPGTVIFDVQLRRRMLVLTLCCYVRITNGCAVSGCPQIQTVLVFVHSLMASIPPSRPRPLRL
jgi:hypothetical protein